MMIRWKKIEFDCLRLNLKKMRETATGLLPPEPEFKLEAELSELDELLACPVVVSDEDWDAIASLTISIMVSLLTVSFTTVICWTTFSFSLFFCILFFFGFS